MASSNLPPPAHHHQQQPLPPQYHQQPQPLPPSYAGTGYAHAPPGAFHFHVSPQQQQPQSQQQQQQQLPGAGRLGGALHAHVPYPHLQQQQQGQHVSPLDIGRGSDPLALGPAATQQQQQQHHQQQQQPMPTLTSLPTFGGGDPIGGGTDHSTFHVLHGDHVSGEGSTMFNVSGSAMITGSRQASAYTAGPDFRDFAAAPGASPHGAGPGMFGAVVGSGGGSTTNTTITTSSGGGSTALFTCLPDGTLVPIAHYAPAPVYHHHQHHQQ